MPGGQNHKGSKTMEAKLRVTGLSKSYGGRPVVDGVSFDLLEGEVLSLVGPSGAGKSTILRAILGLEIPDSGTIELDGNDLANVPLNTRNIGMVFQQYSLFPFMTVWDNVAFPLMAARSRGGAIYSFLDKSGKREIERRVKELLTLVGLAPHATKTPRQLSGGEQQRVAIARALVPNPTVLCLDEPFSALDRTLREELQTQVMKISKSFGMSVVYVTHDHEEALRVSNKIVVLRHGKVMQTGRPEEVYSSPSNEFVASFLGPCNIFRIESLALRDGYLGVRTSMGAEFLVAQSFPSEAKLFGFRPESLRLSSGVPNTPFVHEGLIHAFSFQGATTRIEARLLTGESVLAHANSSLIFGRLAEGAAVYIEYEPRSIFPINDVPS